MLMEKTCPEMIQLNRELIRIFKYGTLETVRSSQVTYVMNYFR